MIATMLSFAVLEVLKKVGRLPEFREGVQLYAGITGVILVVLIAGVSVLMWQHRKKNS